MLSREMETGRGGTQITREEIIVEFGNESPAIHNMWPWPKVTSGLYRYRHPSDFFQNKPCTKQTSLDVANIGHVLVSIFSG